MKQAMLSLEKAARSIRVLLNDVVVPSSISDDLAACRIGIANSIFIFHLPFFAHFSSLTDLEMLAGRERRLQFCAVTFLGEKVGWAELAPSFKLRI